MTFISASGLERHRPRSPHLKYSDDQLSPVCSKRRAVMGKRMLGAVGSMLAQYNGTLLSVRAPSRRHARGPQLS